MIFQCLVFGVWSLGFVFFSSKRSEEFSAKSSIMEGNAGQVKHYKITSISAKQKGLIFRKNSTISL
jgi:hypothetical protein